jgi:hypothetical protein
MAKVPHLVTAYDDSVIFLQLVRAVERKSD